MPSDCPASDASPPRVASTTSFGLDICSTFDGGNCARVEQSSDDEISIWTSADCAGTPHETRSRTWFCFSVRGPGLRHGRTLHFHVHGMSAQTRLYNHGMQPVCRSLPSSPAWRRVSQPSSYTGSKAGDDFVLHFSHRIDAPAADTLYFAFCYPYSYTELMARLAYLDSNFEARPARVLPDDEAGAPFPAAREAAAAVGAAARVAAEAAQAQRKPGPVSAQEVAAFRLDRATLASLQAALLASLGAAGLGGSAAVTAANELARAAAAQAAAMAPTADGLRPAGVYYQRELLCRSLEGRRVDLLTVTGTNGMLTACEPPLPPPLLPEGGVRPNP